METRTLVRHAQRSGGRLAEVKVDDSRGLTIHGRGLGVACLRATRESIGVSSCAPRTRGERSPELSGGSKKRLGRLGTNRLEKHVQIRRCQWAVVGRRAQRDFGGSAVGALSPLGGSGAFGVTAIASSGSGSAEVLRTMIPVGWIDTSCGTAVGIGPGAPG